MLTIGKLARPTARRLIARGRLFASLDRAADRRVTWIWGPAGAGKTSLVASYVDARHRPCVWYELDAGDADVASFFYYLNEARPRRRSPLPLLSPEYLSNLDFFARRFFRLFYAQLRPGSIVVFDNHHDVPPGTPFHDVFIAALEEAPPTVRVIVVSRANVDPRLARLRANQVMTVCDGPALRLTLPEARALIRRLSGPVTAEQIRVLWESTDGWAAGLVLMTRAAARAKRRTARGIVRPAGLPGPVAAALPDVPQSISDYFAAEVFGRADGETRDVLLRTAVLDTISPDAAVELSGRPGAARILATLAAENFFTMEVRGEFRYHPLFRAFLVTRAATALPSTEWADLHRKAALHLERTGQIEKSAQLLGDSQDWEGLSRLVTTHAGALIAQGRHRTVAAWLDSLPAPVVDASGWLLFWRGATSLTVEPKAAVGVFDRAIERFLATDDVSGASLAVTMAVDAVVFAQENFADCDRFFALGDALASRVPDGESNQIHDRFAIAFLRAAWVTRPDHPHIDRWAARVFEIVGGAGDVQTRIQALLSLIAHHSWRGDLLRAAPLVEQLRQSVRLPQSSELSRVVGAIGICRVSWMTAAFPECRSAAREAIDLGTSTGITFLRDLLRCELAVSHLAEGDAVGAEAVLQQLASDIERANAADSAYYYGLRVWHALHVGDVATAVTHRQAMTHFVQRAHLGIIADGTSRLMSAQVLVALEQFDEADVLITSVLDFARRIRSPMFEYSALLLRAYVRFARGANAHGHRALADALALGRHHGFTNSWWWRKSIMSDLAVRALTANIEVPYVQALIRQRGLQPEEPPLQVDAWPWPIRIRTLGQLEISGHRTPARVSRKEPRKPYALLTALVAFGGDDDVDDARLARLLWPKATREASKQSLKIAVHRLRRLLGDEAAVRRDTGRLALNRDRCWVDVWAVEEALQRVNAALGNNRACAEIVPLAERVLTLYRGDFAPSMSDEPWVRQRADRLRRRIVSLLHDLGTRWDGGDEWPRAVGTFERALHIDPCAEQIYQRLIAIYARLGRHDDVRLVYERCRRALSASPGVEPSAQTETLVREATRSAS